MSYVAAAKDLGVLLVVFGVYVGIAVAIGGWSPLAMYTWLFITWAIMTSTGVLVCQGADKWSEVEIERW